MLRLYPLPPQEIDPYDAYRHDDPTRALVRINMVCSLDGRIVADDGVSGELGDQGDRQVFFALRHLADGIVAGAGTVRAEDYGGMRVREEYRARRIADGRDTPATIVVVTRSLDLDPGLRVFTDTDVPPIILTTTDAPADRLAAVSQAGAMVVQAGVGDVDLAAGFNLLRQEHGLTRLLCEGGPTLNAQLLDAGLVEELCMTLAAKLTATDDEKRIVGTLANGSNLRLASVLHHEDELLLRYAT